MSALGERQQRYRYTARQLADARIRYAEAFLRFRVRAKSDGQAHQQAIVETQDAVTLAEAEFELARRDLDRS